MIVKGHRAFVRGRPAVVLDVAAGQVTIELEDGRVEIVPERELVAAESAESAKLRERPS